MKAMLEKDRKENPEEFAQWESENRFYWKDDQDKLHYERKPK